MIINNKKKVTSLKRLFFLVSVIIALITLVLFLLDFTIYGIAMVGVFTLWFLYFQVSDYQYIEFSNENNKILLRYYKAVKFGKVEFSSIEFPQKMLQKVIFENSIFGKMSDLTLNVKTKRGIAEYPSVSFTAVSIKDRKKIKAILYQILAV